MQRRHLGLFVLAAIAVLSCICPAARGAVRHETALPDIAGYKTLKCDFHMHTVFSDGEVWPTVRVEEAWKEGLDVIAITDHIEYQPHKQDIPTNHNRPYEIAKVRAEELGLLLVRGCEITRPVPPGHFNVLFTEDNNAFDLPDFMEVMKTTNAKGAFVFWNHPRWGMKDPNTSPWTDTHTELVKKGWLGGIEVVNRDVYYKEAHRWCLEKGLTMLGNSDIHPPSEYSKSNHRPMTLVFAKDKTIEAVKEALKEGRTAVWSKNLLIGNQKYLQLIFYAAIKVTKTHQKDANSIYVAVRNSSDIEFTLKGVDRTIPAELTLPANSSVVFKTKKTGETGKIYLFYTVTNLLIEPGKGLPVTLTVSE